MYGLLHITGRIKELIITAGGENIAPVPIEDSIKRRAGGVLSNVVLIGDKMKFNTALITLKQKPNPATGGFLPALDGASAEVSAASSTAAQAAKDEVWIDLICKAMGEYNANDVVSNAQKVQKFTVRNCDCVHCYAHTLLIFLAMLVPLPIADLDE